MVDGGRLASGGAGGEDCGNQSVFATAKASAVFRRVAAILWPVPDHQSSALKPSTFSTSREGALQAGDIELLHLQHGLEGAL
jgi:hypothetical protein